MIETAGLSRNFWDPKRGDIAALLPTDLSIGRGEIFGLLGPNGAGKTTLLRMLATVIKPSAGTASVNGFDIISRPMEVKRSIGFLSGNTRLYGRLTSREMLAYFAQLYDMESGRADCRIAELSRLLDMQNFLDQRIEKLSTGQTQKASIARCLLHDPPVLILDEPTLGLDIMTSRAIIDFIRNAAASGKTVIFSTHYMTEAELLCRRIGLQHLGRLMDVDTLEGYRRKTGKQSLADIFMDFVGRKARVPA
jgi:sodium transport system ATP-binding protein